MWSYAASPQQHIAFPGSPHSTMYVYFPDKWYIHAINSRLAKLGNKLVSVLICTYIIQQPTTTHSIPRPPTCIHSQSPKVPHEMKLWKEYQRMHGPIRKLASSPLNCIFQWAHSIQSSTAISNTSLHHKEVKTPAEVDAYLGYSCFNLLWPCQCIVTP